MKNCEYCEVLFKGRKRQRFCSVTCSSKSQIKKVVVGCSYCKSNIELWPSWLNNSDGSVKKSHYCNTQCKASHQQESLLGSNNPNYKVVEDVCVHCGAATYKTQNYMDSRKRNYCGRDCVSKHMAVVNSGVNNPSYNPSLTDEDRLIHRYVLNGDSIKRWRAEVYKRDKYTCQVCGDDSGGNLNAHHLDSWDIHEDVRFDIENGLTACSSCHSEFHNKYGYGKNTRTQFDEWLKSLVPIIR